MVLEQIRAQLERTPVNGVRVGGDDVPAGPDVVRHAGQRGAVEGHRAGLDPTPVELEDVRDGAHGDTRQLRDVFDPDFLLVHVEGHGYI